MATLRTLLLLSTLGLLGGCTLFAASPAPSVNGTPPEIAALALNPQSLTLSLPGEGEGRDLYASRERLAVVVTPQAATASLEWASKDQTIASVDGTGLVTAVGTGTTEVSARLSATRLATASITVLDRGEANVTLQ